MLNYLKYGFLLFGIVFQNAFIQANNELYRENQLKAVYLVHFAELTHWPAAFKHADTFKLCLYVPPTLAPFLNELKQEPVLGKQIEIEVINSYEQDNQCRIIYFSDMGSVENLEMLAELYPKTLLVGNHQGFIDAGGSISFTVLNNKIKLLINLNQIRLSGLDISSKLLRIATVVD